MELTTTEKDKIELDIAILVSNVLKNKSNTERLEVLVMNKLNKLFVENETDDLKGLVHNKIKRTSKAQVVQNIQMFEDFGVEFKIDSIRSDCYRDFKKFIYENGLVSTYQKISKEMVKLYAVRKYQ